MRALALLVGLAVFAAAEPDEQTRIQIVEYMLKTPLNQADPKLVSGFMSLDYATLPKKLRVKARAKQLEVDGVVRIHKGKKKGPMRYPSPGCVPKRYGPEDLQALQMIQGSVEIAWDEEEYAEKKTNCTEDQLSCEFSLMVIVYPPGKVPRKRFFLIETDPLMALVAEKRGGGKGPTRYFQEMKPTCEK